MNENKKKFELDEFWNDCINKPCSKNNNKKELMLDNDILNNNAFKNNKKNNNNIRKPKFFYRKKSPKYIFTNENDTNNLKSKIISNTLPSQKELKNLKIAILKEDLIPKIKNKKQEKTDNIFLNLYKKEKLGREQWAKNNKLQKEKRDKSKLKECTFKPEKSKNKILEKKINKLYKNSNIYQRNIKLKKIYDEKIAYMFNETNKMNNIFTNNECYFHPIIKENKNINKILYNEDNKWKIWANNDSNKLFLLRYMKAREKEYEKNERLNSPVKKILKYNFSYPKKMVKSLSEKDSLILRKNLHNVLYSFKNLFTDEDEEKNNIKENQENKEGNIQKNNNNNVITEKKLDSFQWTFANKKKD